jgi:ferredoxin
MAYVITDPCVATCDTACVSVCPVDAIAGPLTMRAIQAIAHEDRPRKLAMVQLYIDPEVCICCAACEPECPVNAIFDEGDVPEKWADSTSRNANFFRR